MNDVSLVPGEVKPWSPDQEAFLAWLALPSFAREPRSQRAFAAQLEVDEATLSRWKKLPGFGAAVARLALEQVKAELAPILFAQVVQAKKGSLPHAQWLFEVTGVWTPRSAHELTGSGGSALRVVIETVDDRPSPD